ncbi:MAG: hypothetical protein ACLU6P_00105 [Roseburia intestinalis]
MKKSKDIVMETDVDTQLRKQGVVSNLDGASVIKVPATRHYRRIAVSSCAIRAQR